jgi:hypothetical protein
VPKGRDWNAVMPKDKGSPGEDVAPSTGIWSTNKLVPSTSHSTRSFETKDSTLNLGHHGTGFGTVGPLPWIKISEHAAFGQQLNPQAPVRHVVSFTDVTECFHVVVDAASSMVRGQCRGFMAATRCFGSGSTE